MWTIIALGPKLAIEAAASALDALDPSPACSISHFEIDRFTWRLEAFAETEEDGAACLALVTEASSDLDPRLEAVPETDWVAMALDGLPAVDAGRFVVAGAHALERIQGGRTKLWIEAQEAFGTGHHGTTWGCLMALERLLRQGKRPSRVLDIGAGSGVLAIAAARAGAKTALGVEIDVRAADIANVNARLNRVKRRMRCLGQNAIPIASSARQAPYDLVFANILFRPLVRMARYVAGSVKPQGHLVLSGLLERHEPLARLAYENRGFRVVHRQKKEGWITITLRKQRP